MSAALAVSGVLSYQLPAVAAPTYLGCKYNASGLSLKWQEVNTTAYAGVAESSIRAWNSSAAPVYFTKVTSGANLRTADGNFGTNSFDGILLDASGVNPDPDGPDNPLSHCRNGFWTETNTAWLNRYLTDGYSTAKRQNVFVHEIGHALGLAHNSSGSGCSKAIMHPYTNVRFDQCGLTTPQADDTAGANALY